MKTIILLLSFVVFDAFADVMADARKQGLDFGGGYKNSASSTVTAQNKSSVPGYTTDNPEQTKYFDGASTDNDAQAKIKNSQEGDLMIKGLPNRPQATINPNDSFLNTSKAIEGNPDDVVAMLTGTYGECKPLTFTKTENEIRTCDQYEEPDCINGSELVSIAGDNVSWSFPSLQQNIPWSNYHGCKVYYNYMTISIADVAKIDSFVLQSVSGLDAARIKVNGTQVYSWRGVDGYLNRDPNDGWCAWGFSFSTAPNTNLKPYLVNGDNKIELQLGVPSNGFINTKYLLSYDNTKKCQTINTCKNIPSNCSFQSSKCLNFSNENICNYAQNIYNCATTTTTSTAKVTCGSNTYCINGQCDKAEEDSKNDFAKSISYLSALNEAGKDNNGSADNLKIFSGKTESCEKETAGYNNCCRDDGWGQDYMGAQCKEDDIRLAKLQSKKLCHYVGSYCSKKIPLIGKCLKTKKTYCCFNSKISRVISEQGRAQLGIGWGEAKSPDCRGLTPQEMEHLQFDKMDMGEISSDIAGSTTIPDAKYLEEKARQSMRGYEKTTD